MSQTPTRSLPRRCIDRSRLSVVVYVGFLAVMLAGIAGETIARGPITGSPPTAVALVGVALCAYFVEERVRDRLSATLDTSLALTLLATVFAGPVVGLGVALAPEGLRVARRKGAYWHVGLLANVVSASAMVLTAATLVDLTRPTGAVATTITLIVAGVAMALVNYGVARLLLEALGGGPDPATLLRREFLPLLPLELVMIALAAACGGALDAAGPLALAGFAALMYLPQMGVDHLVRAPSVARLPLERAAGVYRAALGDELALDRGQRRSIEQTDALVERGHVGEAAQSAHLSRVLTDAMLVTTCNGHRPTQARWRASTGAQVVLVARAWAQLTASGTPALSHAEALHELATTDLWADAPDALRAMGQIIDREGALTLHVAGVPRMHRLPLPRPARLRLTGALSGRLA